MPGTKDTDNVETVNEENVAEKDSTSESPPKKHGDSDDRDTAISEAGTLLAQGKRHLFVKDYPSAVAALGDACSKFSEIYGELAYECADAYFNYGSALLELAREESGVLDVENKDGDSEESEEGVDEEAEGKGEEKKVQKEKDAENKTVEEEKDKLHNNAEKNTVEEEGKDKPHNDTEKKTADEEGKDKSDNISNENETNEGSDEGENDEDINNLQLSWEMFELARRSFHQKNDELKLSETYLKLGEVALESENYDSAISDIQNCLELQKKILSPISREIAETYYQLGVACSLSNQFDEAIKNFTSAGEVLENRIQRLNEMTDPEPERAKNPFYSVKNEIEEIKGLLLEIKDKLVDMDEFKKETMKVVQETIGSPIKNRVDSAGSSSNGVSSSTSTSSKPANDISHLIRKKRKPQDDSEATEPGLKKPNMGSHS